MDEETGIESVLRSSLRRVARTLAKGRRTDTSDSAVAGTLDGNGRYVRDREIARWTRG